MIESCLANATKEGGFLSLDELGRTGKPFLISLVLVKIRSEGNIKLAMTVWNCHNIIRW